MELDRIDHLMGRSFDHHLISAEIRASEELETFGHAIELQSVVLPNAEDAGFAGVVLPNSGFRIVDAGKDWILRLDYANEPVLIFRDAIGAAFFLLLLIERYHAHAKTQPDQLMSTANPQNRNRRVAN